MVFSHPLPVQARLGVLMGWECSPSGVNLIDGRVKGINVMIKELQKKITETKQIFDDVVAKEVWDKLIEQLKALPVQKQNNFLRIIEQLQERQNKLQKVMGEFQTAFDDLNLRSKYLLFDYEVRGRELKDTLNKVSELEKEIKALKKLLDKKE